MLRRAVPCRLACKLAGPSVVALRASGALHVLCSWPPCEEGAFPAQPGCFIPSPSPGCPYRSLPLLQPLLLPQRCGPSAVLAPSCTLRSLSI